MFKINRKVEYALMALHFISEKNNTRVSAKEIGERYGAPFDMISRVLQQMVQTGWLKSEQGAHGGYRLCVTLEEISLLDLSRSVLGPTQMAECLKTEDHSTCDLKKTCSIMPGITSLNSKMVELYKNMSVSDVIHNTVHSLEIKRRVTDPKIKTRVQTLSTLRSGSQNI